MLTKVTIIYKGKPTTTLKFNFSRMEPQRLFAVLELSYGPYKKPYRNHGQEAGWIFGNDLMQAQVEVWRKRATQVPELTVYEHLNSAEYKAAAN